MIGEGEPLDTAANGPTKLDQAKEAVQAAACYSPQAMDR
jgi:hypothetical protein